MSYYFLTGATGLLGNYLLRDLLLADQQVAVLARSNRRQTARQRVELLLSHWDEQLGRPLPRPVILEGDISRPDLGLDAVSLRWASESCSAFIHNAASLTFQATSAEGEPYRSNVEGTRNAIDFCRAAGIREFHHVSTAYVAGMRSGRVLETEGDVGQEFGNDYEKSKLTAETLVRGCSDFESLTVYRPSIIIGDSTTGYTTTYHGFYAALQLVHTLKQMYEPDEYGRRCGNMVNISLNGDETKHLVPVNWVSAAMVHILRNPELHGQTYHLTPRKPVTAAVIRDVLEDANGVYGTNLAGADYVPVNESETEALFREHIKVYNSYWRMDPEFDRTNIERAVPNLPCPEVDHDLLMKLSQVVIDAEFPTPSKKPVEFVFDAQAALQNWVDAGTAVSSRGQARRLLGLDVRGAGGGQWQLIVDGNQVVGAETGLHSDRTTVCRVEIQTFAEILQGKRNWSAALSDGSAKLIGNGLASKQYAELLEQLCDGALA